MTTPVKKSPVTLELLARRAQQADEGRVAMAEYQCAERNRISRMKDLRRLRLANQVDGGDTAKASSSQR
jgi:hypothetical protein